MKRDIILSASAASTIKSCPVKYRNAYVYGIRRAEEPEPRRVGTNWHEGQDVMYLKPEQPCSNLDKNCYLCHGTGKIDDPMDCLARMLSYRYSNLYPGMPRDKAEVERVTLLYSLFAYKFHYDDSPLDVISREVPFRIPLIDPSTRKAVPNVWIDGKIDKLIKWSGRTAIMEHKSTSDPVAPDSDYWGHLNLDTQTMLYVYAAQRLLEDGLLEPFGIKDQTIGEIMYDVWHKPQISPKKLSQADTMKFVEEGKYFDREFEVKIDEDQNLRIDGELTEVEQLKKGFAIRETPDMYGCRLFGDMNQRPDFYFARRLITRTSEEIERFEWELFSLYQSIASMIEHDSWYHNEYSCDNYGKCDYCQFCFTGTRLDPKHPPAGFVNIFDKGKDGDKVRV